MRYGDNYGQLGLHGAGILACPARFDLFGRPQNRGTLGNT
ncbi:hypothetical protein EC912_105267 [Luteibacter rhizovicinus]|uniref:Uncharacterized protein n=1 Tax=Luteibacter rhizovicinus TaxID=242606 RepID=A0A4R3YM72_9GAMM|nr:hypothetical protein EC912_105267 [Luteibacter rhizovicinus]